MAIRSPASNLVAIRGATVLTVTRGTIQNGVVVLRNGRIEAVGGGNTPIPANADVIDATGRFVSPGIIDTPTWAAMPDEQRDSMYAHLAATLPAGRVGTAEDVARGIWLLLTNGFVTGTVLGVDGGHRLAAP